mmetsp:Transcript_77063/g.218087  ORF Transcript_77063/g.218087 Transcript_77063/m.218087 type:complete len:313 (-) Transcript_77063:98-1036(-)
MTGMVGPLPLVGAKSDSEEGAGTSGSDCAPGREEGTKDSASAAWKRITSLLSVARRADSQGDYRQACEVYSEVLRVQRSLSSAQLGKDLSAMRDAIDGVEARLQQLRQELREGDGALPTYSRPTTSGPPGGLEELPEHCVGSWPPRPADAAGVMPSCWDTTLIPECPLSAREGCDGRPTTRDGGRPCTQDGTRRHSRTAESRRPLVLDGERPAFREDLSQQLDGMRPSTRDGARLQQMIDGSRRDKPRPHTKESSRPSTRSTERRGQEAPGRQASSSRRRRHHVQAPEVHRSVSPESPGVCVGLDENIELLE